MIGSRYVPGGTVVNWPKSREFLSRGANLYNRIMLGVRVKDATGGFRVYHAATLREIDLNGIQSAGYCFQIDMTLRVLQAGLTITEVPITFIERERGTSKMSNTVIFEAFTRVARWGIGARLHGRSAASSGANRRQAAGGRLTGGACSNAELRATAVGDVGDGAGLQGAPLLDYLKALGEYRLKVLDGPAFHEHVPVAARRLDLLR